MSDLYGKMATVFGPPKIPTPTEEKYEPEKRGPGRPRKEPDLPRGIPDIGLIAQAQAVFTPINPTPKGPSAPMVPLGSAGAMDQTGAWGGPNK